MENKIYNAAIGIRYNDSRKRSTGYNTAIINFKIAENVLNGQMIKQDNHYFEIHAINIDENNLLDVEAHEIGYYSMYHKQKDFDIRNLIDYDVTIVTDLEEIKRVKQESCFC